MVWCIQSSSLPLEIGCSNSHTHTHTHNQQICIQFSFSRFRISIYWIFGKLAYAFENWKLFILKVKQCEFRFDMIHFQIDRAFQSKFNACILYAVVHLEMSRFIWTQHIFAFSSHILQILYVALHSFNGSMKNLVEYSYVLWKHSTRMAW